MGVVVRLPESLRDSLKDPFGSVYTDAKTVVDLVDSMLVTVGDVVTYECERVGRVPDVAVVDERTKRTPVRAEIKDALGDADVVVENPAGAISEAVLVALRDAVGAHEPVRIRVVGEEDLVTLPAIIVAPLGASVVYGQPNEGMVLVEVTAPARQRAREIIDRMDGAPARVYSILGVDGE